MSRAISIVSGGMDSVTLAYLLHDQGYNQHILSFDYGQRHRKELEFARMTSRHLGTKHSIIDLSTLNGLLKGSALTDDIEVPDGHYAAETMKITVVPNRNAIMLSIAYGVAIADQAEMVAIGVHAGDHFIYPDCRSRFIDVFSAMQEVATEGFSHPDLQLYAPFVDIGKHDIARLGAKLGVSYQHTWSCYKGEALHCGKCGTCVERIEAFEKAEIDDPTQYVSERLKKL